MIQYYLTFYFDFMEQSISKFSLQFRGMMLKIINDDFYSRNKLARLDPAVLSEKYRSLINNFNGFLVICDFTTGLYEYVSEGIKTNLGYDFSNLSREEMTDHMISIIKDNHKAFLLTTVFSVVMEYLKKTATPTTGTDYRYTVSLKLRNRYEVYQWYLVDTVIIETDENGFPTRTLITCTNIDHIKKDNCIYYNIMKKNEDGVYQVMLEGNEDNTLIELGLSPRELQIINLISLGNSNKQIADQLNISLHTVQTHRKNVMKKTKCSGTAELTNFAFARGLL
jgi:DNA-binding CsgD family transcriptional regulator